MVIKKPRVKDKETRIKEIQAAAKKVFFQKGFQNASVEEVAKIAGVSKGTIYFYFKNKDDLYISLMLPLTEELGRRLIDFASDVKNNQPMDFKNIIMGICNLYYRIYKYDPDGIRIIQAYHNNFFSGMSEETRERLNTQGRKNFQVVRRMLSEIDKLSLLPKEDIFQLTDFIWATFMGVVQLEESKLRTTKKDHLGATLKLAFSVIANGFPLSGSIK